MTSRSTFGQQASDTEPAASGSPIEAQVSASGARVEFELSLTPLGRQEHMLEDRTLPPRVRGRGLVDTGTTMSLISEAIADVLSPGVIHSVELRTALGSTMAPCHAIEFQFAGTEGSQTQPIALVAARVPDLGEDMVIGLDVLRQFRFEWDGPQDALRLWPTSGRTDDFWPAQLHP